MSIENQVIKFVSSRDNYTKYKEYALNGVVLSETRQIINDIGEWLALNSDASEVDWAKFRIWFRFDKHKSFKAEKKEQFDTLITEAQGATIDPTLEKHMVNMSFNNQIRLVSQKIAYGEPGVTIADIEKILEDYKKTSGTIFIPETHLVPIDATAVASALASTDGLNWRLDTMNKAVGPLNKSDFIMIGKRPESGGTSFMISEMVHMLPNIPEGKKAIIFHNEEGSEKVAARVLQSALDVTTVDIIIDPKKVNEDWERYRKGKEIEIYHKNDMTTQDIDLKLSQGEYYLIGFNILSKVKGYFKDEEHQRYAKLACWARNLAIKYGVVFAIAQADYSAEGECYLNQSQLFNSKTEVQQETDVLIMIGKSRDHLLEDTRFISIVRNKKPCIPPMDPKMKYARFETWFDHSTGIYRSK